MTTPDDTVARRALQAVTRRHFFRRSGLCASAAEQRGPGQRSA